MPQIILSLGILYFVAHGFTAIFAKTRVPDVLLLMIFGIIIGPLTNWVSLLDFGKVGPVLGTLTLIVILFESGTGLSLKVLKSSVGSSLGISLITFFGTVIFVMIFGRTVFGLPLLHSSILGVILGGTSSAVVIPLAKGLNLSPKAETILVLESALTDVLCIVLTFALLGAVGGEELNISVPQIGISIVLSFVFAAAIGLIGACVWAFILGRLRNFPNTILTTLAFSLILYGLSESLQVSGAIAALAFGLGLANHVAMGINKLPWLSKIQLSVINPTEQAVFREIAFALKTFFFIYLGISMNFSDLEFLKWIILMVIVIYSARLLFTKWTAPRDLSPRDLSYISVLVPKGLAAAVLASVPVERGIPYASLIQQITFLTVLASIVLTAVLIPLIESGKLSFIFGKILKNSNHVS